uniref:GDP-fucose protein O-fucosyltransferase 2 n=1 Tax=Syphacia muris TaxID=451379 RepID=A0A0N5AS25_9BILA
MAVIVIVDHLIKLILFGVLFIQLSFGSEFASVLPTDVNISERRYLLYDVNYGEGFNLRRDVYMRVANTVRLLRNDGHNYILVLPPWGGLYHWKRQDKKLPWSLLFDISSLNEFVPVIEFEQFLYEINYDGIDNVAYLQHYAEGWTSGNYVRKYDFRECLEENHYRKINKKWHGWFFGYDDVWSRNFSCISIQGDSATLVNLIEQYYPTTTSLFIDRAEHILHDLFGDKYYWQARRSMRYAKHLIDIGNNFRRDRLGSTDAIDKTELLGSWIETQKSHGDALGGDYLCVHWRRRDFVRAHEKDIPSINGTAVQISKCLEKNHLTHLFLSTDAAREEVEMLTKFLPDKTSVLRYVPDSALTDAEVSIIDQWICAHGRWFIGTHYSTFSYRIQEDREILGFKPETTFNRLCPDDNSNCEQPAKWRITYDNNEYF